MIHVLGNIQHLPRGEHTCVLHDSMMRILICIRTPECDGIARGCSEGMLPTWPQYSGAQFKLTISRPSSGAYLVHIHYKVMYLLYVRSTLCAYFAIFAILQFLHQDLMAVRLKRIKVPGVAVA